MRDDDVDLAANLAHRVLRARTVRSPVAAAAAASSAMRATRWALSAIWREDDSSSLVVISVMAVACSRDPAACWLAAACSSVEELWMCWMADPIWWERARDSVTASVRAASAARIAMIATSVTAKDAASLASRRADSSKRFSRSLKAVTTC